MAVINSAKEALSILGQATGEYKGTRQDHAYIEAALKFVKDALTPLADQQEEDVKPQTEN
jgi:hypothetical protein